MDAASLNRRNQRFAQAVVPHLDAGYNLARWLLEDDSQARDAVQSAALRALAYLDALRGDDGRAWFLGIVRHQAIDALRARADRRGDVDLAELLDGPHELELLGAAELAVDARLLAAATRDEVNAALRALPVSQREVLVLREIEDLSYEAIARITDVPAGTVMSRLARARALFRQVFAAARAEAAR